MAHGAVEVRQAVMPDAGFRVGSDVGGMDRSQRCGHFQAASEWRTAWHAVAGHAIAKSGDIFATGDQRRVDIGHGDLIVFKTRDRLAGDIPGQQACRD
ncbi:hypothetical protein D3C73_1089300 [compost metagenome]